MTRRIPLFPLPGVVLFPGTLLPLHIFESRYREMVAHALAGERMIGMSMLKPGVDVDEGASPIFQIGGAGQIVESEELEDGRYNILLEGKFRFRVVAESQAGSYRTAEVEQVASLPFSSADEAARVRALATNLFEVIRPAIDLPPLPDEDLDPERLASEIALRLRYRPAELQAILETNSIPARYANLIARMMEWQKRIQFLAPFRPGELDVTKN
ncbi:MAG TPA: LON peptidase substrate-binding domain-containing protein [Thermoanaerobaculia bacterium]|nr:LON peptidase substrate-binding domain-containing protein [Thermoanaerobaculia bacterium]